MKLDLHCYLPN